MDPTEQPTPLAALAAAAGQEPPAEAAGSEQTDTPSDDALTEPTLEHDSADTLSPAVRRLVRQYDLDITGIHGTGPAGRIRVGDVIGMLGGRTESAGGGVDTVRSAAPDGGTGPRDGAERGARAPSLGAAAADEVAPEEAVPHPATMSTVFECDLSRVLSHRKRQRAEQVDVLLTSYFLLAYEEALKTVAELTAGRAACFGVQLTTADGELHPLLLDSASATGTAAPHERLRSIDTELRANVGAELVAANLIVHHYGASGSVIATPTPIAHGHSASLGIGRVRREVVVRTGDGDEAPRVAAMCHLSLSFLPDRISLHRANAFMANVVRILEQWAA